MKYYFLALSLCILSLVTTTTALNTTFRKSFFYVSPDNNLSYDLFQTHNGIISHSIEGNASRYSMMDLQSKEIKSVLTDLSKICDPSTPIFQNLHYHVPTDSLVYFCSQNNSLLVLDQSSFTVQATFPFNLQGKWPVAKLSTDGVNIAVLLMGELFTTTSPQASVLVKVDVQAKQLSTVITLNQSLDDGEAVVAYVANKKSAYVATNRILGNDLTTVIYSFLTNGSSYKLTEFSRFNSTLGSNKFVTKLFLVGDIVAVNNAQDLYLINPAQDLFFISHSQDLQVIDQQGMFAREEKLAYKPIANGLFDLAVTSQYGSNDLYYLVNGSAFKLTVTESMSIVSHIGDFSDMQIAHRNQTSGDLMLTIDYEKIIFSLLDLKTLKPIYSSLARYNADLLIANSTYSTIQADENGNILYGFNLTTDSLIWKIPLPKNYIFNQEQWQVSYLNRKSGTNCTITHVDIEDGDVWESLWFGEDFAFLCDYSLSFLRINWEVNETPEFVIPVEDTFYVHHTWHGLAQWGSVSPPAILHPMIDNRQGELYAYHYNPETNEVGGSTRTWRAQFDGWTFSLGNTIKNVSASKGLFHPTAHETYALSNDTVTVIYQIGTTSARPVKQFPASSDWNSITFFKQGYGKDQQYLAILSQDGVNPALLSYDEDSYIPFPGWRNESVRANTAGYVSYWIEDAPSSSVKSVRFFDVHSDYKEPEVREEIKEEPRKENPFLQHLSTIWYKS